MSLLRHSDDIRYDCRAYYSAWSLSHGSPQEYQCCETMCETMLPNLKETWPAALGFLPVLEVTKEVLKDTLPPRSSCCELLRVFALAFAPTHPSQVCTSVFLQGPRSPNSYSQQLAGYSKRYAAAKKGAFSLFVLLGNYAMHSTVVTAVFE